MVHGGAPFLLVDSASDAGRWVWRGHGDLSAPQAQVVGVLATLPSALRRGRALAPLLRPALCRAPRYLIAPAVDPLDDRNRDHVAARAGARLDRVGVPRDKPYLVQVGEFTRTRTLRA
jgi:hypothetical protein